MNNVDKQYFDFIRTVQKQGTIKSDRTGTGTKSIFSYDMRFKMSEGFPLLTSKRMAWKSIVVELLWFLKGDTNIKYLVDNGCNIWVGDALKNYNNYIDNLNAEFSKNNPLLEYLPKARLDSKDFIYLIKTDEEFAKKWGELGPVYGAQWRDWGGHIKKYQETEHTGGSFGGQVHVTYGEWKEYKVPGIDQIQNLINDLKNNPDSRRLLVSAWNVGAVENMVLPPCHYGFQCYTREIPTRERKNLARISGMCPKYEIDSDYTEDKFYDIHKVPKRYLSLKWTQRSCDVPLGIPFNIASYGLLLHILAKEVNMIPDELIFSGGDCHIYLNQLDMVSEQLKQETYPLPKIEIDDVSIFDLSYKDIKLIDYQSSKAIYIPLSN